MCVCVCVVGRVTSSLHFDYLFVGPGREEWREGMGGEGRQRGVAEDIHPLKRLQGPTRRKLNVFGMCTCVLFLRIRAVLDCTYVCPRVYVVTGRPRR